MAVSASFIFDPLGHATSPYSDSAIAANVENIENAEVIISLETHQSPSDQLFHAQALHDLFRRGNDRLVVVEDSSTSSSNSLSQHHQICKVDIPDLELAGWDHPDSVEQYNKVLSRIAETRKAIDVVLSQKPFQVIEEFFDAYSTLLAAENHFNRDYPLKEDAELIVPTRDDSDSPAFKARMIKLSEMGECLNSQRISHLVKKTFSKRQNSLIKTIDSYAGKRIFLIAGRWHGNREISPFPKQVDYLIQHLKDRTTFVILDADSVKSHL
ncbi:MAG: hypothetical protein ACI9S8_001553 [Chlamydiales bacterium]|jgi:hypothetical protein